MNVGIVMLVHTALDRAEQVAREIKPPPDASA